MVLPTETESLFRDYFNINFTYDELFDNNGQLRSHWETFFQSFDQMGHEEIESRSHDISRLLKENGVTYNIHGEPAGLNRPWKLDPIPFIISKSEWQTIKSGLKQRAELFDLILKDIYGPRKLMKNGLLPMDLIYNHAGFLRECAGIQTPGKHSLILYSADMARSPDGNIWVVNDRTQAPSGSGYALENRMAMARILPEFFNGLNVGQLSPYFDALRNALIAIAPHGKQDPRIVILTPGPSNETYFEHSYLSSFLGYTLVQGDDLMVKDNFVWLKTLGKLEKVDVILRRVDDRYCDPLELKEDSQLGVAGLLNVVRKGNVSIANPLGSSILENPGLMPFLQNISRHLLGTSLIIPTIASWWCGQPKELKYVIEHIDSLVIKRIHRDSSISTSVDVATITTAQKAALILQIKAHPYLYVGQEKVNFSSIPSLVKGKIEPRNALFRSFLVSNRESYTVMRGGLTRISAGAGNFIISNQLGGNSKDTWIITPEPGRTLNIRKELPAITTTPQTGTLPSHTAENLFWVGRYAERILGNARFQRTVMRFVAEGNRTHSDTDQQTRQSLLYALTHCTFTYPGFADTTGHAEKAEAPWKELRDILFNPQRAGSLSSNLSLFTNAVYAVRDHWSTDTWRVLRGMEEEWHIAAQDQHHGHLRMLNATDNLITSMVAFIGLNRESISREQGWTLLDTGRKIEQSLLLLNMLRSTLIYRYDEQQEYDLQESVLISNESLVNYRYKYRAHLRLPLVLDLMLLDPNNPRSLIYQVERLQAYLSKLPKPNTDHTLAEHERLVLEVFTQLKLAEKDKLAVITEPDSGLYNNLDAFLTKLYTLLMAIPDVISKTYFKHAQTQQQLFAAENNI